MHDRKWTENFAYSIKYNNSTRLKVGTIVSFIIAIVLAIAFAPDANGFSPLSCLFLLFLLVAIVCVGLCIALTSDHYSRSNRSGFSKIYNMFNVTPAKFAGFWDGGTSKASYRTYKKFLDGFGHACVDDEERKNIIKIIVKTASDNQYHFTLNERNCKEVSAQLKDYGIEASIEAFVSGVPIEDVLA